MKQKLDYSDIERLMLYDQKSLASDLNCEVFDLVNIVTVGNLLEVLRKYHQINVYTVNTSWCIQLFDFDVAANDQVDCIYENHRDELIDVLYASLAWVYDHELNRHT